MNAAQAVAVSRRSWLIAAAGLLLLLLVWRRLLLQGEIPVDGNLLTLSAPHWRLLRSLWEQPRLPLWDPWRSLGQPHLADPQAMALYPPALLLSALPDIAGFLRSWVVLHALLAGAFWWLLVRRRTGDAPAAALAAALGACSGFFTARVTFPNHFASAAWLPAALLALESGSPLGLGAALALQWLAGFPPFSLVTGAVLACVAAARGRAAGKTLCGGVLWSLGLAAAQWLPFLQFLLHSDRAVVLDAAGATLYSVPPLQLLKMLVVPFWDLLLPRLDGDPAILGFYVGPVVLLLALYAARGGRRLLAAGAAAALLLALGGWLPGYAWVPPLRLFRFPANWLLAATAALTMLAAHGAAALPGRWRWPAVGLAALDLALFAQVPRQGWARPELVSDEPALASRLKAQGARVYHEESLRRAWEAQSLEGEKDYLLMRESLAPSFGAVHGVAEASGYQVLGSREASAFRRWADGPDGAEALSWAGVGVVVGLAPGAARAEPGTVTLRAAGGRRDRVFSTAPRASVAVLSWAPGRVRARVESPEPAAVVLGEAGVPGWTGRVDGRPAPVALARGVFPELRVPAGDHEVEFLYRPWTFGAGLLLSVLTAAAAAWSLARRRAQV
ncbi:MAG: hypothetical protein A2X36_01235 [Elusimicrobia bacterium GWA2_69_24]|nr:MAG: hypothetical protein A2X36_01235 [Elusimicrobia bacterium GWA2_69_24]HBL16488.1 hypothetical protein [Elusimicrobiota bacterium]